MEDKVGLKSTPTLGLLFNISPGYYEYTKPLPII
jgi:hypothetical protein